jgi:hypothetical protein
MTLTAGGSQGSPAFSRNQPFDRETRGLSLTAAREFTSEFLDTV